MMLVWAYLPIPRCPEFGWQRASFLFTANLLAFCLAASSQTCASELPPGVLATVNGRPITEVEIEIELAELSRLVKIDEESLPMWRDSAMALAVYRSLLFAALEEEQMAASDADVELALKRLERRLERQGRTLNDYFKSEKTSLARWKAEQKWALSWQRYLEKYRTEEALEKFFQTHRRDFDGTRLKVAHILWKLPDPKTREAEKKIVAQAEEVRRAIVAGEITFADAAKKHSQAPTANEGGHIGAIGRYVPMPKLFNDAAFALQIGEVSEPVKTYYGIHIITVLEELPGNLTLDDVRSTVEKGWENHRFAELGNERLMQAKIVYREDAP